MIISIAECENWDATNKIDLKRLKKIILIKCFFSVQVATLRIETQYSYALIKMQVAHVSFV